MAHISAYAEKAMLDWVLLGATPTRPGTVAFGLSLGSPTSTSGSEIVSTYGYSRQSPAAAPFGYGTELEPSDGLVAPSASSC